MRWLVLHLNGLLRRDDLRRLLLRLAAIATGSFAHDRAATLAGKWL